MLAAMSVKRTNAMTIEGNENQNKRILLRAITNMGNLAV